MNIQKTVAKVDTVITGQDLRMMRIHAKLNTADMAAALAVKSRKTIENWEQQNSEPGIATFIKYCMTAGFDPARVIVEVKKRNQLDPTQSRYFDLDACLLHQSSQVA